MIAFLVKYSTKDVLRIYYIIYINMSLIVPREDCGNRCEACRDETVDNDCVESGDHTNVDWTGSVWIVALFDEG